MKKLSIILVLLSIISLLSCKKIDSPEVAKMALSNVAVAFSPTSSSSYRDVVITADYTYPGPLGEIKLLISNSSDMNYASAYSVNDNGQTLTATVNSLRIGNTYYFCMRYYDGIGYNYTDGWKFTVE